MPLGRIFDVLIKYHKMMINWPPWVYFYSEFTARQSFDSLSNFMQGSIILSALLEILRVEDAIALDQPTAAAVSKSTGPAAQAPSFVICLSAPYPAGVGNANWAGTCRAMLNNRTFIGIPALHLVPNARPILAVPPPSHPTTLGDDLLTLHSVVYANGDAAAAPAAAPAGAPAAAPAGAPAAAPGAPGGAPAGTARRTTAAAIVDSDDENRMARVVEISKAAAPTAPKRPWPSAAPRDAAYLEEMRRKAREAMERRKNKKYVEIDSDEDARSAADAARSVIADGDDGAAADAEDGTTEAGDDQAVETIEDDAAPGSAEPVRRLAPPPQRVPARGTRSSPRKAAQTATAPTTEAEESETEQLLHPRARKRKAAAALASEPEQDELDDESGDAQQAAASGRSRQLRKKEKAPAPPPRKTRTRKAQVDATEVAGGADEGAADESSRKNAKDAPPAKTAKAAPKPKAAAKGGAATKAPAAAAKASAAPSNAAATTAAAPEAASKKRKRDEPEPPADAPPGKSARTDAESAEPAEPAWKHRPLDDAKGHPWTQAGFKNLKEVLLSKADVKRLTANPAKLTPATGAVVKRVPWWPKGFQMLLGIDDEDNIMWTVLSRAFQRIAELSADEKALVKHAYTVWPKDVPMSGEMRTMFLDALLG